MKVHKIEENSDICSIKVENILEGNSGSSSWSCLEQIEECSLDLFTVE
jgi:hypothetical protein